MKAASVLFLITLTGYSHAMRVTRVSDIAGNEAVITQIDLSNKGLSVFPEQILQCKNLQELNLSNNGIIHVPAALGSLESLVRLDLSGNQGLNPIIFSDLIAKAKFKLQELNVAACGLLALPEAIGTQNGLRILDASDNRLVTLPYSMMQMGKLERVDLSNNTLHEMSWVVNYWWNLASLDVTGNNGLMVSSLLTSLSFFDRLEYIAVSQVDFFPETFDLLNVGCLKVTDSEITSLPRSRNSTQIKRLIFDNCTFVNTPAIVRGLNEFSAPDYIEFKNMHPAQLVSFLELEADSVSLTGVGHLELEKLAEVKSLRWIDLRNNAIQPSSIQKFSALRPDVDVLLGEQVLPNVGINPPIEKYNAAPVKSEFIAGNDVTLRLGQTSFEIASNSIVDAQGNVYTGEVTVNYREFMNPADIFFSGIPMTADLNGETMMFSSGGMFEITAEDTRGNELFVNPESPIEVNVFSQNADPGMELFFLNKEGVWEMRDKDSVVTPFKYDQAKIDSVLSQDFYKTAYAQVQFVTDRYIPVVKWDRRYNSFQLNFLEYMTTRVKENVQSTAGFIRVYDPDHTGRFFTRNRVLYEGDSAAFYFSFLDSISRLCMRKYELLRLNKTKEYRRIGPNYMANFELVPDYENDRFNLSFIYKDSVIQLPVNLIPSDPDPGRSMKSAELFYRKYLRSWKISWKARQKNRLRLKSELMKRIKLMKEQAEREEKLRQEELYAAKEYLTTAAGSGSIIRAFSVGGFGVWNCDVRTRMGSPTPITREFMVLSQNKMRQDGDVIVVIDHDKNSVIQFEKDQEAFFDAAAKTTIVIFFSQVLVGIHNSWKHNKVEGAYAVELLNIENMNKETFSKYLMHEE